MTSLRPPLRLTPHFVMSETLVPQPSSSLHKTLSTTASNPPTVHLVDADTKTRGALATLLRSLGLQANEFDSAESFLNTVDTTEPGCLILEQQLPGESGDQLHTTLQRTRSPLGVVFVTSSRLVPLAVAAIQGGAEGYLLKPVREQELLDLVNRALRASSRRAHQQSNRHATLKRLDTLTPREHEVLKALVSGLNYDEVAKKMGITKRTVEAHRRQIMDKTGSRTLPELLHNVSALES